MKCLILAAGQGSRLRSRAESKPLLPLLGVPLVERAVRTAMAAGADRFVVVTGHAAEQVEAFLGGLAARLGVPIDTVRNPDWAQTENGRSILAAEGLLEEPFLLLMADHLFEPELARDLLQAPLPEDGLCLAVDGDRGNPLVDAGDVTRVRRDGDRITAIGKGLEPFDGYDTGIFHCTPALFDALRAAGGQGDTSLSAAVQWLAAQGRARAVDVSGRFWCDVDDEAALHRAEEALLRRLRGKTGDGPVSRWLNRPLSIRLTRRLADTPVTPNQISLFSFLLSVAAAALFLVPWWWTLALGGILAQAASVIDGCDGEIARLRFQGSDYGGWFDAVLDRYADAFLLAGLTGHAWQQGGGAWALAAGFLAVTGSFMVSYTADKYDGLMRERGGARFRMGRDVRVFLIFLGALLDQVLPVLMLIAGIMNLETVRRLIVCRGDSGGRQAAKGRPAAVAGPVRHRS